MINELRTFPQVFAVKYQIPILQNVTSSKTGLPLCLGKCVHNELIQVIVCLHVFVRK